MHPVEVFTLYEKNWGKIVTEEFQLEDAEINCDGNCNGSDKYGPFHFMKLFVLVEVDKLNAKDRGWEAWADDQNAYKLLDFERDQHLLEELKNEPPEKFFYTIYFWPQDAYDELTEDIENGGDEYMDEGTGDWSRDIEYDSPTIDRFVAMLQKEDETDGE